MSKIYGAWKGFKEARDMGREQQSASVDALVKQAALDEAGYEVPAELFGGQKLKRTESFGNVPQGFVRVGGKVVQDPNFISQKDQFGMMKDAAMARAYDAKAGQGATLPPSRQSQKDKRTEALFGMMENNAVKRQQIADAEAALPNVPTGWSGKMRTLGAKWFNPNDPILGDWQKVKSVLTDAQLLNTAKTKGAISDQEMQLFAQAAANDDLISMERVKPIIAKLKSFIDAEQNASVNSYKQIYNEDPMQWPEMQQFGVQSNNGYLVGQVVNISGKQYRVIGGDPNDPELEEV